MPSEGSTFDKYQTVHSRTFAQSLLIEFFGVLCFQFLGGTSVDPILTPFVNGFALAVLVYLAADVSGGHLNPAVTVSTFFCGFYPALHSFLYIVAQIAGAIFGAMISLGLTPGASFRSGKGPGCFTPDPTISDAQLFGWEAMMTFVLIGAVYSCGIAKPGHGSFTPLVVGLSLLACAGTGGSYTGAALNPARVLGPQVVFQCAGSHYGVYIGAQIFAAFCACLLFVTVSGWGPLFPFMSKKTLGITQHQAVRMWLTGTPPGSLGANKSENLQDVLAKGGKDMKSTNGKAADNDLEYVRDDA